MSRSVADNSRDAAPDNANLSPLSGPITQSQGRSNNASTGPSSPTVDMFSSAVQTTLSTNGTNAGDNSIFPDAIELAAGERSPGPHLEDMTNGVDNEVDFLDIDNMNRLMNGEDTTPVQSSVASRSSNEVFDPDLRRVKIYELVGSRWTDRGTAFCAGDFENDGVEGRLTVKAEITDETILSCSIRLQDVYQRQQESLIVWTEPDGTDYALSFQDTEGCNEVWEFILEVQRRLTARVPSNASQIIQSGHLPQPKPEAFFINEIEKALRSMARQAKAREQLCSYMVENRYIHQLVKTFEVAEKNEDLDALHALCTCVQTILLFNEHAMYEHILQDELWLGVVGILEYDPEFPKFKANYREFLLQRAHFMQPIVINDETVQLKIHATYRLQYLKDVILGRALDDSTFNVLNSFIIFNQIDIINHVQHDERFLSELVSLFIRPAGAKGKGKEKENEMEVDKPPGAPPSLNGVVSPSAGPSSISPVSHADESADVERKKEIILLLQQLCVMGKNVQLPARIGLFRTLVERGVLYAVQWALCRPEKHMVFIAGEILSVLLDHHILSVRMHILIQALALGQPTGDFAGLVNNDQIKVPDVTNCGPPPFKETLSQVLCRMIVNTQDMGLQTLVADALRLLVDVPPPEPAPPPEVQAGAVPMPNQFMNRPFRDDTNTERFLDNFYKVCLESLMRPLTQDVPDHHDLKKAPFIPSRERSNLYLYLCDLLCSFATQHSFRSYFFILSSNVASRVATLLSVKDKHTCLAALRFFRICLRMNNRNLFTHMHKHDCFTPICDLTIREARRENLLSSSCQEYFDFMRKENLKDPINHIMEKHETDIRELAKSALGFQTFQSFVARWEINKEPPPPESEKRQPIMMPRIFGQRVMESEEDDSYFNSDENEEDPVVPVARVDSFLGLFRRKRQRISVPGPHVQVNKTQRLMSVPSQPQQRPTSPLSSLLEYDDDEDATSPLSDQARSDREPSTPNSPVLPHRQIQILPYEPNESEPSDPEDDLLESLVSKNVDEQMPVRSDPPSPKLPEKRRRKEEDDDAFEKLAPKNRRLSNASDDASKAAAAKARATVAKPGEEGPKRLKLRFNATKPLAEAKPVVVATRTDSKDDGNG